GDRREDIPLDFEILSNGHFVVLTEHSTYNYSIFRSNSGFSNSYWVNAYYEYQRWMGDIVVNPQNEPALIGGKFWNSSTPRSQLISQLDYDGNLNWSHYFDLGPNSFLYHSALDDDNAYLLPVGSTHFARVSTTGESSCGYVDNTANFNVTADYFPYTVHDDVFSIIYYAPTLTLGSPTAIELPFSNSKEIACPTCEVGSNFQLSDTLPCRGDTVWFFPATDTLEAYYWLVDGVLQSRQDTFQFAFDEIRDYSIKLIGRVGVCLDTSSYTLTVGNAALTLLQQDSLTRCLGATLKAGTSGLQYLWSTGDTSQQTFVNSSGLYQVHATDSLGCVYLDSIYFEATAGLLVQTQKADVSCNATQDGMIELTVFQATPPLQIDWNTGAAGPLLTGIPGGYYFASIQDSLGCQDSVALTIDPSPSVLLIPEDINCSNLNTGSLSAIINGGTPPFHY
ncbi:MAG: SprB repeat-containing protein, partial [Phaeodactylibacter sp.]|nr:SprB repeat-containing protein [Phaeodactylibacter sp.]